MSSVIPPDDRRSLGIRLSVLQYTIACVFVALAVGFWVFQVAKYAEFKEIAESQYLQRVPLPAPRGLIVDRDGKELVRNQNSSKIVLMRERTKDVEATLQALAEATGLDVEGFREKVERRRKDPSFRPIVLIDNATPAQVAAVQARALELPGILKSEVPARSYLNENSGHLFGYVSEVSDVQLARAEYKDLGPGAIVGQAGLEQAYNRLLMGREGTRDVIVNSRGREIREVAKHMPDKGTPVMLTIDADLQRAAEDGFRHYGILHAKAPYNGAAVILDPRSGEVLSLVSLPAYDSNKFAMGMDAKTWSSLLTDKERPLSNRALQSTYSPGSTFKLVVATAAMEEGVAGPDFRVYCGGGGVFYGRFFQCHLKGGHGSIDMRHAIEKSCNTYFYTLGQMLGVDRIHKWATLLGLGQTNGIDLPNELPGLIPSSEWKLRTRKEKWYPGETISVAIGQGQVTVTPLSLAVMMMTLANGGTRYTPHLLKAADYGDGKGWQPFPAPPPRSQVTMKKSTVDAVHEGLWLAVNGAGTAGRAKLPGRDVSGKTGTAQVISLTGAQRMRGKIDVRDHGWFVFMAPRDNPELAGVIFAEHAEHGYYGASIAKHIIDTYYAKKEGRPLPELVLPGPTKNVVASAAPAAAAAPGAAAAPRAGGTR
jgi:penicillin-binding protein 2